MTMKRFHSGTIVNVHTFFIGVVSNVIQDGGVSGLYPFKCASLFMYALEGMSVEGPDRSDEKLGAVSTHGPRGARREEWRKSKGLEPIPKRRGMNRQGGLAARRKAGRPSRRR